MLVREDTSLPTPLLPSRANLWANLLPTYILTLHCSSSSLHLPGPSCHPLSPKEAVVASSLASLPPLHCIILQRTTRVSFQNWNLDHVSSLPHPCQRPPLPHGAEPQGNLAPASLPGSIPTPSSPSAPATLAPSLGLGCSFRPSHGFFPLPGTWPPKPGSLPSQRPQLREAFAAACLWPPAWAILCKAPF